MATATFAPAVLDTGIALGFSALVRERRDELGLSLDRLAQRAGITKAALVRIEQGPAHLPPPAQLQRLAEAIGERPARLIALAGYDIAPGGTL